MSSSGTDARLPTHQRLPSARERDRLAAEAANKLFSNNGSAYISAASCWLRVACCVLLAACCLLRFVRHASADHLNMFDGRIDE